MGTNANIEGRAAVLGANMLVGCLKGGIGAAAKGDGFWQNCGKGALGGTIAFTGEEIASHNSYPFVGAAGKLIHDAGISISDNVMRGEDCFSQFRTDVGPINLLFRGSYVPKLTFTLTPVYGIVNALAQGAQFDIKNSAYNLTPIFLVDDPRGALFPGSSAFGYFRGATAGNVVQHLDPKKYVTDDAAVLSHEVNHALFWKKLSFTNELFHPFSDNKYLSWWDVGQDLSRQILVLPQSVNIRGYYSNPQELEAYAMQRGVSANYGNE